MFPGEDSVNVGAFIGLWAEMNIFCRKNVLGSHLRFSFRSRSTYRGFWRFFNNTNSLLITEPEGMKNIGFPLLKPLPW